MEQQLKSSSAEAWLFWHNGLGMPDPERIQKALTQPGDLWHAGLRLGMSGLPGVIDFVAPTWMLNRDPNPTIEATSWRLSLRACLVRTEVLRQMGGVHPEFETLAGAALEMGHRYVMRGVLTRHILWLLPADLSVAPLVLPFEDELRFAYYRFGRFWCRWAAMRAILTGYVPLKTAFQAWRRVSRTKRPSEPNPFIHSANRSSADVQKAQVSVLIPTLDRYPYLRTLLKQLRQQKIKPLEIIVADQTPTGRRDTTLAEEFGDLPLKILYLDRPGQCSSRNAGLQIARGDYVLFLDDDEEVPPTLIEAHLQNLHRFGAEVSSGVADEVGAGPLPEAFTYTRASDVFPTNNILTRRPVFQRSGLFDLAYEHGQRADADLGMRVYLSGALMVLNPDISVLHHHAPQGGLRVHKARVITYASSRRRVTHRHLPSVTEIYLAMRYFTPRQVREMLWLRAFGTFSIRGGPFKKMLKVIISLLYLPDTLWQIRRRYRQASRMFQNSPQIPTLT
jgi:glycosyltransferase involved in cell wall biosynthesis